MTKSSAQTRPSTRRRRPNPRSTAKREKFICQVVHELRTPLAQIRLVLDTVRLGRLSDPAACESALAVVDREVLRLQHLVDGILRFTCGTQRSSGGWIPQDAAQEAHALAREFQPLAAPRGVTIAVTGDTPVPVRAQSGAIRQVLINLLDNALKYGGANRAVTVNVTCRPSGGALLAVSDSGPGVAGVERDRIWRPFERGRAALATGATGSGIGLAVVRAITTEHGGSAWVENVADGGARFVIDLPCQVPA